MYGLYNTVDDQITRLENPTKEQIKQIQEMIGYFDDTVLIITIMIVVAIFSIPYPKQLGDKDTSVKENKDTVST